MSKWMPQKHSISSKESGKSRNALSVSVRLGEGNATQGGKTKEQCATSQLQSKGSQQSHFTATQKANPLVLPLSSHLGVNKSQHTRPPFLYEHYPLKPALLYGSPSSYVRDPLKRLDQISFLPQNSLHSISATLPTCQCALVNPHFSPHDNGVNLQPMRLVSGADACSDGKDEVMADSAHKTINAYKIEGKSEGSVCSACRRDAFLVPQNRRYSMETLVGVEDTGSIKNRGSSVSTGYKNLSSEDSSSNFDKQTTLQHQGSLILYPKPYRDSPQYATIRRKMEIAAEAHSDLSQSNKNTEKLSTTKESASTNSLVLDYNLSVPIFELLMPNEPYDYTNQLAVKHKDSLLFYADLRQKRRKSCAVKSLEIRRGKILGFVRFLNEARLVCKPSDEDIVFGSAGRSHHKSQCWEESRIAWLAELERRQEVRTRRKRRSEEHKANSNTAESAWGQWSFLCDRIRLWLAKWYT